VFFLHSNNANPVNTNNPGNVLDSFSSVGSDAGVTSMSKDGVELVKVNPFETVILSLKLIL